LELLKFPIGFQLETNWIGRWGYLCAAGGKGSSQLRRRTRKRQRRRGRPLDSVRTADGLQFNTQDEMQNLKFLLQSIAVEIWESQKLTLVREAFAVGRRLGGGWGFRAGGGYPVQVVCKQQQIEQMSYFPCPRM
jgi:hypothetical protein